MLDRAAHRLSLREQELTLTSTEFRLLEFFLMHPGRAYSREQLLEEVWGQQHYVSPRTVDVHVRRLREQIESQPDDPQYLTTVRGFGYRFELPPQNLNLQPNSICRLGANGNQQDAALATIQKSG